MVSIFTIMTAMAAPSTASVAVTMAVISVTTLGAVILKKFNK